MTNDIVLIIFHRREQIAELTRLGQTLMHIKRLFWIVADDSESCNPLLDKLMDNFGEHEKRADTPDGVVKLPPRLSRPQESHMFIFRHLCPFYIDLISRSLAAYQIGVRRSPG